MEGTATGETAGVRPGNRPRLSIQDASGWVLRAGVITSLTVMATGLMRAFFEGGLTGGGDGEPAVLTRSRSARP